MLHSAAFLVQPACPAFPEWELPGCSCQRWRASLTRTNSKARTQTLPARKKFWVNERDQAQSHLQQANRRCQLYHQVSPKLPNLLRRLWNQASGWAPIASSITTPWMSSITTQLVGSIMIPIAKSKYISFMRQETMSTPSATLETSLPRKLLPATSSCTRRPLLMLATKRSLPRKQKLRRILLMLSMVKTAMTMKMTVRIHTMTSLVALIATLKAATCLLLIMMTKAMAILMMMKAKEILMMTKAKASLMMM